MDRSLATYLEGMGSELTIPHTMYLLLGPRAVVVDTSFESVDAVRRAYPQEVWRDADEEPSALLAQLGISPDQIELVICTHLHYDHCGSNRLFSKARVLAQRIELEYALNPVATVMQREFFSPTGGFSLPYDPNQIDLVEGDVDLGDGLRLLHLPGHTPGSQGVVVSTGKGVLGLLGDNVMVEENWVRNIPVGLHTNVDAWYRSMSKAHEIVGEVIPSHDLRVFASDALVTAVA
jgi:glyoxylase-like metal-dependent hydrolase (beta-lactamase superfamily II)